MSHHLHVLGIFCDLYFTIIISFYTHKIDKLIVAFSPFHRWRNWDLVRLRMIKWTDQDLEKLCPILEFCSIWNFIDSLPILPVIEILVKNPGIFKPYLMKGNRGYIPILYQIIFFLKDSMYSGGMIWML